MQAVEIIENVLKDRSPYEKTVYLLKSYKDIKQGKEINDTNREVITLIDKVLDIVKDDEYINIIICLYVNGFTYEKTMEINRINRSTLYKQRRRLIKRISLIMYGDRAL